MPAARKKSTAVSEAASPAREPAPARDAGQPRPKPWLGSHMSVAGGCYRAVELAAEAGCDCVQVFTKNASQWKSKPLTPEDGELFRAALEKHQIVAPVSHASYLINLASPSDDLWQKSLAAMVDELERAAALGIPRVVVHPGAHVTASEEDGIATVINALGRVLQQTESLETMILLENTAGQGTTLGWRLEHLAEMIDGVRNHPRVGVCIDTCHAFAAGYDLRDAGHFAAFADQLGRDIGFDRVGAIHLNDSRKGLGQRIDRHEHIGEGMLGLEAFRHVLNHHALRQVPMYLETEKGDRDGESFDVINLRTLRGLVGD